MGSPIGRDHLPSVPGGADVAADEASGLSPVKPTRLISAALTTPRAVNRTKRALAGAKRAVLSAPPAAHRPETTRLQ